MAINFQDLKCHMLINMWQVILSKHVFTCIEHKGEVVTNGEGHRKCKGGVFVVVVSKRKYSGTRAEI